MNNNSFKYIIYKLFTVFQYLSLKEKKQELSRYTSTFYSSDHL